MRRSLDALSASLARIETDQNALGARLDEAVPAIARVETSLAEVWLRLGEVAASTVRSENNQGRQFDAIRLAVEDEASMRRLLREVRNSPDYEIAWTEPNPLVSVCIPTFTRWKSLVEVAIPSVFEQTHANVEVVVVGDAAAPEIGLAIERLNEPRIRFENLSVRGPYPDDPVDLWHVAGTGPLNRAMELANGHWLAVLNDDDAFRPSHIASLLQRARETRAEVAYGTLLWHEPEAPSKEISSFPPRLGGFGWQGSLQHQAMRLFEYELAAAVFDEPGDWNRARRMLRAGVRFGQVDEVVVDYWPGKLWPQS